MPLIKDINALTYADARPDVDDVRNPDNPACTVCNNVGCYRAAFTSELVGASEEVEGRLWIKEDDEWYCNIHCYNIFLLPNGPTE